LGGLTLSPGTYTTAGAVGLTGDLTLDAQGDATAVWTIKIGGAFTTLPFSRMIMIGGGSSKNVYWGVEGAITIGVDSVVLGNMAAIGAVMVGAPFTFDGAETAQSEPTVDTPKGLADVRADDANQSL
jgi:hypothetical protein